MKLQMKLLGVDFHGTRWFAKWSFCVAAFLAMLEIAIGGTNIVDLGDVVCPAIGHGFFNPQPGRPYPYRVQDVIVDQMQRSGGGGILPSVTLNLAGVDGFKVKVSAPPGDKFQILPPPGQMAVFGGTLIWNHPTFPDDYYQYGTVSVSFEGLEGAAPNFFPSGAILSRYGGIFTFSIGSEGFSNVVKFSSITFVSSVPEIVIKGSVYNYTPSSESGLAISYQTSQTNDPGPFVSIVPETTNCTYGITPGSGHHGSNSETGTVSVVSQPGCAWQVVNTNGWVSILSGASGTNNGTVTYKLEPNLTGNPRSGIIVIAEQVFVVTQVICTYGVTPSSIQHSPNAETGTVSVACLEGCPWEVIGTNDWISVLSGINSRASGTVTYSVKANDTGNARSGVLVIAGQTYTIHQFAIGGTNTADLGNVECLTIGRDFINGVDFLINQRQEFGGGGVLTNESVNFDENNRYVLKISAPPGKKFQIQPLAGQMVLISGTLFWTGNQTNGPNDYYQYGTLSVGFDGLEGTAPEFSPDGPVLSRFHGLVTFGVSSTGFSNTIRFSSMTLAATVPNIATGQGTLNYIPSGDSGLVVRSPTSRGQFVSLVLAPIAPPVLTIQPHSNGDIVITFRGILQSSSKVDGPFVDVPGNPQGTYTIPKSNLALQLYFRARN